MKRLWILAAVVAWTNGAAVSQVTTFHSPATPPSRPALAGQAGHTGLGPAGIEAVDAVLWDQTDFDFLRSWADQVFTDLPAFSIFQVADISTGGDTWNVNNVSTYFGLGGPGAWSPAEITSANLQVFAKTGTLPDDALDLAPEYTVPITLELDVFFWKVTADTSGIPELQCISGDFWIGLTPITDFATVGQEYHWAVPVVGGESAVRNPGGALGFGTDWVELSVLDTTGVGPPYDGAITLEGEVLSETWADLGPGTGLVSSFWGDTPLATGSGISCAGSTVTVSAVHAGPPFAGTTLVVGFSAIHAPFKGGTLVPNPDLLIPVPTFANGDTTLPVVWPSGIPAGITFSMQFWQNEPPWSATNALQVTSQ